MANIYIYKVTKYDGSPRTKTHYFGSKKRAEAYHRRIWVNNTLRSLEYDSGKGWWRSEAQDFERINWVLEFLTVTLE